MSIGNTKWVPSKIENRIYDLMEKEENLYGMEVYTPNLEQDVIKMFNEEFPEISWELFEHNNSVSLAFVECGKLHLIGWDVAIAAV